jgi:superfamily II helicase
MNTCDICGKPSMYKTVVTTEPYTTKNVDLCGTCYKTFIEKETKHKCLAYEETIEEVIKIVDKLNVVGHLIRSDVLQSRFTIGENCKTTFPVDQHFNWFQKMMWKLCFGVKVEDC